MADGRSLQPDKLATIPLPTGWEAKYDFAQKRYFFIDHQNKTTSWEDPRIKILEKQQQQQQQRTGRFAGESHNAWLASDDRRYGRSSPTPPKTIGTPAKSGASGGWQSQIEDKYGMKVEIIKDDPHIDPEVLKRITTRFPTVGKELVVMIMNDCNSEEEVYQKFREMGYKENKPITGADLTSRSASSSPSHPEKPSPAYSSSKGLGLSGISAKSGGSQPSSPGQKLEPSSGRPAVPVDLKRASPERSTNAKSSGSSDRRSASPGHLSKGKGSGHRSHHSTNKPSPLAEPSTDKKKKLREKLEQEFKNVEKNIVEATLSSCSYDEEKARSELQFRSTSKSSFTVSPPNTTNETTTEQSGTTVSSKSSTESFTVTSEAVGEALTVLVKEATAMDDLKLSDASVYVSSLRRETKGPDPSLVKGPNKQLLLTDYVAEVGSKSTNCHGPCKENYHGPSAELRRGHEPGLNKGPSSSSVYGLQSSPGHTAAITAIGLE